MSTLRLFAIFFIFGAVSLAWMILGGTLEYRTAKLGDDLSQKIDAHWGPSGLMQLAPCVVSGNDDYIEPRRYHDPLAGDVKVDFVHHNRYMGLLWFSTYTVRFTGDYLVKVPAERQPDGLFIFRLPVEVENIAFTLDGQAVDAAFSRKFTNTLLVKLPGDGKDHTVGVSYEARGRDYWGYTSTWKDSRTGGLKKFALTATMNFPDIDYLDGSVSPIKPAQPHDGGMQATWQYDTNRTEKWIGIEMPSRQNAGPIAARMSFFAPVSLFFFITVLFTVVILKKIPLHPMHYLFIAAGFFAFHILMAYLVDVVENIHVAFWICSAVSVFLVVSYMRLVAGVKFAVIYVGLAQLVYLVGFSYAFFWRGWTGLTVVIGAIATLFVLMQATGRIKWAEVFKKRNNAAAPPVPPPVRLP